jgi:hypothetical protein
MIEVPLHVAGQAESGPLDATSGQGRNSQVPELLVNKDMHRL